MITEHRFRLVARCPVDSAMDLYDVTVRTTRLINVESIVEAADEIAAEPAYQEQITETLAHRFGVDVETVGTHMVGRVTTTCRAPAALSEQPQ